MTETRALRKQRNKQLVISEAANNREVLLLPITLLPAERSVRQQVRGTFRNLPGSGGCRAGKAQLAVAGVVQQGLRFGPQMLTHSLFVTH